ncbi:MAG: hypothetical protein Edafosvirus3_74 [Edafosvirus sp.]|uniref:Uncharacterized protein n=1 Tax=Edafosvirus sp. TaxID=2487765 RepID=A0A3G4ZSX0_9VIRU|nr:MAG: hypothetical protein Edafosvirus3_74 [Edafosvirus sp.]
MDPVEKKVNGNLLVSFPNTFTWKINDVSKMVIGKYIFSESFFFNGIWYKLQAGRIRWEREDGPAFTIFLSVDLEKNRIKPDDQYLIKVQSNFIFHNVQTGLKVELRQPSKDTFMNGARELGYFDAFKQSWEELTSKNSLYVNSEDQLSISVSLE